jgi:hypothetical protein
MSRAPLGNSVEISTAPSQEYLGGRLVVGTPNSLVSTLLVSSVAVSDSDAVAMMSPWRLVSCSTGSARLLWVAVRAPVRPGIARVVSPAVLLVQAGASPGPA